MFFYAFFFLVASHFISIFATFQSHNPIDTDPSMNFEVSMVVAFIRPFPIEGEVIRRHQPCPPQLPPPKSKDAKRRHLFGPRHRVIRGSTGSIAYICLKTFPIGIPILRFRFAQDFREFQPGSGITGSPGKLL